MAADKEPITVKTVSPYSIYYSLRDDWDAFLATGQRNTALHPVYVQERPLSATSFPRDFVAKELTVMRLLQPFYQGDPPSYQVFSDIHFSQSEQSTPPHGHYDDDRARRLITLLEARLSTPTHGRLNKPQSMDFLKNDVITRVSLGFATREEVGEIYRGLVDIKDSPEERRKAMDEVIRRSQKGNDLHLALWNHDSVYRPLGNADSFVQDMAHYTDTYQALLNALYLEKGVEAPSVEVSLSFLNSNP